MLFPTFHTVALKPFFTALFLLSTTALPTQPYTMLGAGSPNGKIQSSIYGPLIGTRPVTAVAQQPIESTLRLLANNGDGYAGYRATADRICQWRIYRKSSQLPNGAAFETEAKRIELAP